MTITMDPRQVADLKAFVRQEIEKERRRNMQVRHPIQVEQPGELEKLKRAIGALLDDEVAAYANTMSAAGVRGVAGKIRALLDAGAPQGEAEQPVTELTRELRALRRGLLEFCDEIAGTQYVTTDMVNSRIRGALK